MQSPRGAAVAVQGADHGGAQVVECHAHASVELAEVRGWAIYCRRWPTLERVGRRRARGGRGSTGRDGHTRLAPARGLTQGLTRPALLHGTVRVDRTFAMCCSACPEAFPARRARSNDAHHASNAFHARSLAPVALARAQVLPAVLSWTSRRACEEQPVMCCPRSSATAAAARTCCRTRGRKVCEVSRRAEAARRLRDPRALALLGHHGRGGRC